MNNLFNKILQIGQWVIIVLLFIACICFWWKGNKTVVSDSQYKKTDTRYVNVTSDKTLSDLKKVNEELYDSIKKLKDVKEAIQIKYVTRYNSDTVYITKAMQSKDSTYHYSHNSDTINYNLDINGNNVKWFKLNFAIQDSLMIVTRSKDGENETTINNSKNTEITNTTVFIPKKTFLEKLKDKTYLGVGVGAGYGVINKKFDVYVGISAGIKF